MRQIEPYPLWLGNDREGRDYRQLFDLGIKALVDLSMEEPAGHPPRELLYCRFPLLDGSGNRAEILFLAISTVATLLKLRVPTMLSCGRGRSRTPAVAAAALAMLHQEPPEECLQRVAQHHPSDVSPGLWSEVTSLLPAIR